MHQIRFCNGYLLWHNKPFQNSVWKTTAVGLGQDSVGEQLAGVRKVVLLGWTGLVILVMYLRSASSQLGSSVLRIGRLSIGTTGATRPHVLHPAGIQASLDFLSWQLGKIPTERKQGMQGLWRSEPGLRFHFLQFQLPKISPDPKILNEKPRSKQFVIFKLHNLIFKLHDVLSA